MTLTIRLCGIYKLDGDKLIVCLPEEQGPPLLRPTDFAGDGEGGLYLLTYQRASKTWKPDARFAPKPVPSPAVDAPTGSVIPPLAADLPGPAPTGSAPGLPGPIGPGPAAPTSPFMPVPGVTVAPAGGPPPVLNSDPVPAIGQDRLPPADQLLPKVEAPTPPAAPPSDLDRLQGTWVMTQLDGKLAGGDQTEALEFLRDRVLSSDGKHGRIKLDESKSPRQITITMGKQPSDGLTGIYRLEGDKLTIASSSRSAKLIPAGFETDPEAGVSVTVYERPKAPVVTPKEAPRSDPTQKAPPRDLQKEIDQLREHIQRLEKELKDRKPVGPGITY